MSARTKLLSVTLLLMLVPSWAAAALLINGNLTTDSLFAEDDFGTFYYDAYEFTVSENDQVTLTMTSTDFVPYFAVWDALVLPDALWEDFDASPAVDLYALMLVDGFPTDDDGFPIDDGSFAQLTLEAIAGVTYQVAATTFDYLPDTPLGAYTLGFFPTLDTTTFDVQQIQATAVPEPGVLPLLAGGLALLVLVRTRRVCVA